MKPPAGSLPTRRRFLRSTLSIALVSQFARLRAVSPSPLRAAIIGHTGHGDYGHDLDRIFTGREGVSVVALADPDPGGRAKAAVRTGAAAAYADYQEMLDREKPDLVSLAMRQADQHHRIALACLRANAHLYCEKPFTTCPAESDELLAEAQRRGLKIAVAHNMRIMPAVTALKQAMDAGQLGELVEMRAYGKQDARSGGEDMMVLGTHLFDLMRLFAGSPISASARVLQNDRPITRADARLVKDNNGLLAGNRVFASFAFPKGIQGTFTSAGPLRETTGHWGLELHGSQGVARINCDLEPTAFIRGREPWTQEGRQDAWKPLPPSPIPAPPNPQFNAVSDWLQAVRENAQPFCSGTNGAWAVEMVMGAYESALTRQTVPFPLPWRDHPLSRSS